MSTLPEAAAARRLVDALVKNGVSTFFGVPGGPICPFFEAVRLDPRAKMVESRHESYAAFAAVAFARATGKVPAIVVTAGPGITNAVTGIASAHLERVPMLVVAGDVAWSNHGGRLAQDSGPEGIDIERLLAPITRAQVRIARARSAVSQGLASLRAATDPNRPGPALLVLPIDEGMRSAPEVEFDMPEPIASSPVSLDAVARTARWLCEAERPLLVVGGGCRGYAPAVARLVDALQVPFVTTPRAKGLVSERHPYSLRNGGMAASMWARRYTALGVDVALVLGTDLDDTSMGPTPYLSEKGRLIHVDLDATVFNRNVPTALGVLSNVGAFARDLEFYATRRELKNPKGAALSREMRSRSAFDVEDFENDPGEPIAPHRVIAELQQAAARGTRFVTDIGEHMLFALHYLTALHPDDFHMQLNLGSMGSGIAGATGLALADPQRPVICICGDGGMQMAGMEVLTAIKEGLPIVYAVFNDARYNMVFHGMTQIFGDSEAYETPLIDFKIWAQSLGLAAAPVHRPGC
ncbi:MAG TPA: thiamine pyrophosphate-binding protein, partial [bacterium]|nr:thiamine pyrophosphate-binding protein [bacterium]